MFCDGPVFRLDFVRGKRYACCSIDPNFSHSRRLNVAYGKPASHRASWKFDFAKESEFTIVLYTYSIHKFAQCPVSEPHAGRGHSEVFQWLLIVRNKGWRGGRDACTLSIGLRIGEWRGCQSHRFVASVIHAVEALEEDETI